jgi:Legume lectin domain
MPSLDIADRPKESERMKFYSFMQVRRANPRPAACGQRFRRAFRPVVELLEARLVPSVVDHLAGFDSHGDLRNNGSALFTSSVARLTDGGQAEAGSIFTTTRVNITQFSIGFTFTQAMGTDLTGGGLTFTIQNDPRGAAALGTGGSGLGYGPDTPGKPPGILNSVAVKFDLHDNFETGASTGIFSGGRSPTIREDGLASQFPDMSLPLDGTGIDLHSQDVFQVTLTYDGSTLNETVQDTTTGATFTASYGVNIVSLVGSTAAFIGFTGGSGDLTAVQDIETWAGVFGGQPTLTSVSPDTIAEASGDSTLTVSGSNLLSDAIVQWQGTNLATTYVAGSSPSLTAIVPGSLLTEEGTVLLTISESVPGSTLTSFPQSFTVSDPAVSATPVDVSGVEGHPIDGVTVATFADPSGAEPPSNYLASISWGDGSSSPGAIAGPNGSGVFAVTGNHTYRDDGQFSITVSISHDTASTVKASSTARIADSPLTATGVPVNGPEAKALNNITVASFIDTGGPETPTSAHYAATIDWGDGTTSTGTIAGPDLNGVFAVTGSHTYAEQFLGTIAVTITHQSAPPATVLSAANIVDAPLSATGGVTITGFVGQVLSGTLATFSDTGGLDLPDPSDYLASIDWGDGTTSNGTISGPDGSNNLIFTVTGSHTYTYQGSGQFVISVSIMTITQNAAPPVIVTDTASIPDFALIVTALNIRATLNTPQDQTVAQFIDTDPNGKVGDFTATIDWGDGARPNTGTVTQPGGPGSPFLVDFTHTYNLTGTFTTDVKITDVDGAVGEAFGTATVTSPAAPQSPRGSRRSGELFLVPANGMLSGQEAKMPTPSAASTASLAQLSGSIQSGPTRRGDDNYWRDPYHQRGNEITDPSGWAAYELALALEAPGA